jgi:hypothetical protein
MDVIKYTCFGKFQSDKLEALPPGNKLPGWVASAQRGINASLPSLPFRFVHGGWRAVNIERKRQKARENRELGSGFGLGAP